MALGKKNLNFVRKMLNELLNIPAKMKAEVIAIGTMEFFEKDEVNIQIAVCKKTPKRLTTTIIIVPSNMVKG